MTGDIYESAEALQEAVESGTAWAWDSMTEIVTHTLDPEAEVDLATQLKAYVTDAADRFDSEGDAPPVYAEYGSLRSHGKLTAEEEDAVDLVIDHREPQNCYYNAQTAMIAAREDYPTEEIWYVEGYVVDERAPGPTPHAWVEVNGKIVDPTPPERGSDVVYYGVAYDPQTVRDAMLDREQCDPLAENPASYPPAPEPAEGGETGE